MSLPSLILNKAALFSVSLHRLQARKLFIFDQSLSLVLHYFFTSSTPASSSLPKSFTSSLQSLHPIPLSLSNIPYYHSILHLPSCRSSMVSSKSFQSLLAVQFLHSIACRPTISALPLPHSIQFFHTTSCRSSRQSNKQIKPFLPGFAHLAT